MFHSIAITLKHKKVTMMNQSVDHCGSHLIISKYAAPLGKLKVGCKNETFFLVAVGYYLKQQL